MQSDQLTLPGMAKEPVYTLRKGGKICVTSSMSDLGYSTQELKQIRAAGYVLYKDGVKVKK